MMKENNIGHIPNIGIDLDHNHPAGTLQLT